MRAALHSLQPSSGDAFVKPENHFGLSYEGFSPRFKSDGKIDEEQRENWLYACAEIVVSSDYGRFFFTHWRDSFPQDCRREIKLDSRLLIGHGCPSGSEVGLNVHRTWGVPMIPGSALKGLLANYVATVLGSDENDQSEERRKWVGQTWQGSRITGKAGEYFAALFGSPAVDGLEETDSMGEVVFHDALYVPGSANHDRPFARDVLTVHQRSYYKDNGTQWPNDWDSPNPVSFITIRPGVKLLLAVTGSDGWRELAMRLLQEALKCWGVGGKTSAGYGRAGLP